MRACRRRARGHRGLPRKAPAALVPEKITRLFAKLLIANRGEIACRVALTARRLGIRTVAVYSDADAARPTLPPATKRYIGGPPPRESYLRGDVIIEAARRAGAQAIHPGYGFLSENAGFAAGCAGPGIVFVGPTPSAIAAMGSKSAAKALMEKAGVPLDARLSRRATGAGHQWRRREIGFPC